MIRPLTQSDIPVIREIARLSFSKLWEPKDFLHFLTPPAGFGLGDDSNGLQGYFLGLLVLGELDIASIAVSPEARRKGIGVGLLREALRTPGLKRALLEVDTANTAAISLYEKVGFQRVGVRKKYYDGICDGLLMNYVRVP